MTAKPIQDPPYESLERLFHEPSRLAILSALCAAPGGLSFTELKDNCDLTDGNLSRHLTALQEAGIVRITKEFVGVKPRTTVFLSPAGCRRFQDYLQALEQVLEQAKAAAAAIPDRKRVSADKALTARLGKAIA